MLKAKIQGITRQTSQIPANERDIADAYLDDLGRQITRPYQVRDLVKTALVSLTGGTKTSLIVGVTGAFMDLMQISVYNNSNAATTVDLLDESTTVMTIPAPATSVTTYNFQIPKKQSATGVAWYVDMPDLSGTTLQISADFLQEV